MMDRKLDKRRARKCVVDGQPNYIENHIETSSLSNCLAILLYPFHAALQNFISSGDPEEFHPHFYSIAGWEGNPLEAHSNPTLNVHHLYPETIDRKLFKGAFDTLMKPENVSPKFDNVLEKRTQTDWFQQNAKQPIERVLPGQKIDKIVCIDFHTLEADVCDTALGHGAMCEMTHHAFAFYIRDHLQSTSGEAPRLQFHYTHYTQTSIDLLRAKGAEVFTGTTDAFQEITDDTLVIWMGNDAGGKPVKQIVADFPLQNLPLPRAMLWPREGDQPTTYCFGDWRFCARS